MNSGKIQLDDVTTRYVKPYLKNSTDVMVFFDPYLNTETKQRRNIIVIDVNNAINHGYAEFIDTLAHETWHAVQSDIGLIVVDSNNKISFWPSQERVEDDAYYIGRLFYTKYVTQGKK